MKKVTLTPVTISKNNGDNREFSLCAYENVARTTHDSADYRTTSDIVVGDRHISVKASGFTLMSGNLCEGKTTFEGIWDVYEHNTHSNDFVYITVDFTAYYMTLVEFKQFVHMFGRVEREIEKNGGAMKIRSRKESKKMVEWLNAEVA